MTFFFIFFFFAAGPAPQPRFVMLICSLIAEVQDCLSPPGGKGSPWPGVPKVPRFGCIVVSKVFLLLSSALEAQVVSGWS